MARGEISLPPRIDAADQPAGQVPCVVIVGRPNVGKSSLLNCLARKRISIVDPTAGVTRDRISAFVMHEGHVFEIWDTGGIGTTDDLAAEVQAQIEVAIARADLVLFLVDAHDGLVPFDQDIAKRLRRIGRRVLLVANKVEHATHEQTALEFHALGFGKPMTISAKHGHGRSDLMDELCRLLPQQHAAPSEPVLKFAIVGRQNVGKSTLINTLAHEERVIVSEIPGTTRDAVDVRFERKGRVFVAVDTAGLKRRSAMGGSVEFYSLTRAYGAIRRCDIVLHMLNVTADISHMDKALSSEIEREAKPCIFVVNKWDKAEGRFTTEQYMKYLNDHLHGMSFAPVSFISAQDNLNVDATLDLAESLWEQARKQIPTAHVNAALQEAYQSRSPEARHSRRPKLFYATQIGVAPPTFLVFASNPQVITEQYTRFLANHLRDALGIPEIPLRIVYRARRRPEEGQDTAPRSGN